VSIALRHREEPLVSHQSVKPFRRFLRASGIAQHIRPPLLLGHPHADQQAALLAARRKVRIVTVAQQRRQPVAKGRGQGVLQQGRRGEGHGNRAQRPGLHLGMEQKAGGAGDKRAFAGILLPGEVMYPIRAQPLHQQVPGGMEAHVVQPGAGGVIAQQLRRIAVGQASQLQRFGCPQLLANAGEQIAIPAGAFADHCFTQSGIGQKQIAVIQRGGLIKNGVRLPVHRVSLHQWR